jgi:hypothetical protein
VVRGFLQLASTRVYIERPGFNIVRIIQGVLICWVLSSRPSDNTSRFRLQKNHPYRVDSRRRGHASRDCHGWTERQSVDWAAKSSSSQLGHRGNLCRLWVRVRRLDGPGYKDSQTSSQEYEVPSGTRGASLPTLLLRAGRSRTWKPTCASLGSNGTEGQRPVGLVSANPTRVEWRRRVTRWEKTSDPTILDCCRGGSPSAPTPWLDGHCGPEPWSSWFTVQLIYKGL